MKFFNLTIITALLFVGLVIQTSSVLGECEKGCKADHEKEFIEKALKTCEKVQTDKEKDCLESECCFALGTLQCMPDECICEAIYKWKLDLKKYTKLIEKCSREKRELKCKH